MPHRNAPLTETGRLRLARCVIVDGWAPRQMPRIGRPAASAAAIPARASRSARTSTPQEFGTSRRAEP